MDSTKQWQAWGEKDPLWSASTWMGRDVGADEAWTEDDFYAIGRMLWGQYQPIWDQYGLRRGTIMDLGCGPGRFCRQFANEFEEVIGVDVSEAMLERARVRVNQRNVRFLLSDGDALPVESNSIDAAFSVLVLPHLDGLSAVEHTVHDITRCLRTGGSVMLHISAFLWPGNGQSSLGHSQVFAARRLYSRLRQAAIDLLGRETMQWHHYDARRLLALAAGVGLKDAQIVVMPLQSELRSFLLARK